MIAEIIPQMRTIPQLGIFDYAIPDNLAINVGDIVKINFRQQEKIGLVCKIKSRTIFKKIKPLLAKIDNINLTKKQVDLIAWLATQYQISPALAFKTIFPEIPKKNNPPKKTDYPHKKITVQKNRMAIIQKIVSNMGKYNDPALLYYSNENEKNAAIMGLIKKNKKQTLIIVPEKKDAIELAAILKKYQPILLYSGLAKNDHWQKWLAIKNNKAEIIIGTKSAIFIPSENLGLIIIDHEEDRSHVNFDQNPKYDVLQVAQKIISDNHLIKLILTSQAPSIPAYYKFKHFDLLNKAKNSVYLIDLQNEKTNKNYSLFSRKIMELIERHGKSLLIYNKKGDVKLLMCRDCKEIIPSPAVNCPKCRSLNLTKISYGIKKLEKDLKKMLPEKKIISIEKGKQKISNINDFDIAIGTEYALRIIDVKKLDFIALLSVDHQLALPDYQASEKVWQTIAKLINLNISFAIQTNNTDNFIILSAIQRNYQLFYKKELELRKQLNYPPFDKNRENSI